MGAHFSIFFWGPRIASNGPGCAQGWVKSNLLQAAHGSPIKQNRHHHHNITGRWKLENGDKNTLKSEERVEQICPMLKVIPVFLQPIAHMLHVWYSVKY